MFSEVTEPIDTAPNGRHDLCILPSFAAEERRVITRRTLTGKKEKAERGGFAGGAARVRKGLPGGLVINEQ